MTRLGPGILARPVLAVIAAALALSASSTAARQPRALSILATNAIHASLVALADDYTRQTGQDVSVQFDTSPNIARRLAAGEAARIDVLIATPAVVEPMLKDRKALTDTRTAIGKVPVGVAIRRGARRPDISTVDALKAALLQADAVVYSRGTSGLHVERLLRDLDVTEAVNGKAVQVDTGDAMLQRLKTSRGNELGLTQVSEIMRAEEQGGVQLVGLLPAAVQSYTEFDAVVMSGTSVADAARAFVRALTTATARRTLAASGWEFAQEANAAAVGGYLKASNAGEDDQLSAGDALTGVALAISRDGTTLVVGAPKEDSAATGINGNQTDNAANDAGAAYVFARAGASWSQQAYIKGSNTQSSDGFGFAVALSRDGNTLAVSANFEDSGATGVNGSQSDNSADGAGAVYVFARRGPSWVQQAYIKPSNTEEGDRFGYSVALSDDGETLAVGAIGEDSAAPGINGNQADNSAAQAGAVYVFVRAGTTWSQHAYLKASNAQAGDLFGFCVALDRGGTTLAACGYDEDSSAQGIDGDQSSNASNGSGAAYIFIRRGAAWAQQAYVKASNTVLQAAFGAAIALSSDGNTLAVCAVDEDGVSPGVNAPQWQADRRPEERTRIAEASAGAVYVYARTGNTWAFQAYIKPTSIRANDVFGARLALSADGNVLAAGAPQQTGGGRGINPRETDVSAPESGAVYLFVRSDGRWSQSTYVKAPNADEYDLFGTGVAVSGDGRTLAVGAMGEDSAATGVNGNQADNSLRDSGAVYVYERDGGAR